MNPRFHQLIALTLFLACWAPFGALATWTHQLPDPPNLPSNAVCHGASKWIAVGDRGKIMHSSDGESWTLLTPITDANLNEAIYAGGLFVAAGDDQTILTSSDGLTWTHRRPDSALAIKGIAYGAGVYVMIGVLNNESALLTTADFSTWTTTTRQNSGDTSPYPYTGEVVLFDGSQFIATVSRSSTLTSTDGYIWQASSSNLGWDYVNAGDIENGTYYVSASGKVWSSTDGSTWTLLPEAGYNHGEVYDLSVRGNTIQITMSSKLLVSYNLGQNWQTKYMSGTGRYTGRFGGLHWADSKYVLLTGDGGSRTSSDGTWPDSFFAPMQTDFNGVCHGNGQFVAVGTINDSTLGGEIRSSSDGAIWITRHSAGTYLYDVCYGNGTYVAVGSDLAQTDALILTSTDLTTWTERTNTATHDLKGVIYAGGQFVAVGGEYSEAVILTSPDGESWTAQTSNANGPLKDIVHANGLYVAVGSINSDNDFGLVTSPDGVNWTNIGAGMPRTTGTRKRGFSFVSHGNGVFIAGTNDGYLYRSADGANWTEHAADDDSSNESWKVHFANGKFIAVTGSFNDKIHRSTDGLTWTPELTGANDFRDVVDGDGLWVAVGVNSRIVTAADTSLTSGPTDLTITSTDTDNISLSWSPGVGAKGHYLYCRSSGQVPWQRLTGTFSASTASHEFTQLDPGNDYEFGVQTITMGGLSELATFSHSTYSLLQAWKVVHFGSPDDAGAGANGHDADGDGLVTLVEYAVDGDPNALDEPRGVISTTSITPQSTYSVYTLETKFMCDTAKTGINYYIEISPNMDSWTRIAESVGGARTRSLAPSGVYINDPVSSFSSREVTVQYSLIKNHGFPFNTPILFMRMAVEEAP